ncbi:MAG: response regulator [Bacteroidota bacterium]
MAEFAKKILVAEDDEVNLMIADYVLGKAGFSVVAVDNGEAAVDMASKERFDLILMDIEMPIMSGLEATPLIRQLPTGKDIPIIALTAHSMEEKLEEFKAAGIDDCLIKPFDKEKFQIIANKYLAARDSV